MYLCRPLLDPQFLFSDIPEAITHLCPASYSSWNLRISYICFPQDSQHALGLRVLLRMRCGSNLLSRLLCSWRNGDSEAVRWSLFTEPLSVFPFLCVSLFFFFLPSTCIYTHNPCVCVYTYISIYREYCRSLCADYIYNFTYVRNKIKLCVDLAVGLHIHMYAHKSM